MGERNAVKKLMMEETAVGRHMVEGNAVGSFMVEENAVGRHMLEVLWWRVFLLVGIWRSRLLYGDCAGTYCCSESFVGKSTVGRVVEKGN
jgi:hypothetical protein